MHGFWSYCSGGNCLVCNTVWPVLTYTPTILYLKKLNYYNNFKKNSIGFFPAGLTGKELINIRKQLNDEYKILEGKI